MPVQSGLQTFAGRGVETSPVAGFGPDVLEIGSTPDATIDRSAVQTPESCEVHSCIRCAVLCSSSFPTTTMPLISSLRRRRNRPEITQRPTFSVSLPLEIELLFVDQFAGETIQLRELCRVSRMWAAQAQSLLFREVYVRYKNIGPFLALLQTSNNIGRYIVVLNLIEGSHWHSIWHRGNDQPNLLDSIVAVLADAMPNVRTLDISYRDFGRVLDVRPATNWGAISRLQVRFCKFASTDIMVAFIASFPRLESLDIFQCYTQDVRASAERSEIRMPAWHLRYLAFGEFPQNALIDWIVGDPAEIVVDHFRILSLGPDASSFNALLAKIGGGLRHLEVPGMHRWITGPGE
ncbi:hypothetical protein C8R44DRAFT_298570 [Mycena epipterygia]|nr:hypothetical protein C8R44DRAFT_298570 [Mycena epipterygia]